MAINLLVPDEWLRDFLDTDATPKEIEKYLSLCGPSVEKTDYQSETSIYHIEVTTNRVDTASVYGIAREAFAILPRFGIRANLVKIKPKLKHKFTPKVDYLVAKVDPKLCPRFTAVLIKNVKVGQSPNWIKKRLEWVGVRPINNVVDISNYIMHEIGQPVHTFDYDKIMGSKMILRTSKKGEVITTLDGISYKLPGEDIVIEDGEGRLIDLAGIMGGLNSAVDDNTKNVLLFVQTYNPVAIRKTSMSLAKRTEAVELFEKGLDTELVTLGIYRGIELFETLTDGKPDKNVLDIYPSRYQPKKLKASLEFIEKIVGTSIVKSEISRLLSALGFEAKWKWNQLEVIVPSYRASDINIPEDIVEEIARIYGYHNLPSELMSGKLPQKLFDSPFKFENKIKNLLKGFGGVEVYTLSLVGEQNINSNKALKLKNPLGSETEYLRINLMPSLVSAANTNKGEREPFHLFEVSNVYIPKKNNLPDEKMYLAGIFQNYSYREAKGIIEAFLEVLNIEAHFSQSDASDFLPSQRLEIQFRNNYLGQFGVLENGLIYYEFETRALQKASKAFPTFTPLPKYPAQIEDITLTLPEKTKVGELIQSIKSVDKNVRSVELFDIYKDSYTFRIKYQHSDKTLTNKEILAVRNKILKIVREKYGAILKE